MALPGQDRIGYAVSELMQRMQIYGTYVLGVYETAVRVASLRARPQPCAGGTRYDH